MAERLLTDPDRVIKKAKSNIARWIGRADRNDPFARSYFEWKEILESRSPDEIRRLILRKDDEGQYLRSTTPFAGIVSRDERVAVLRECEEIGFV
ncbi:MAG: hypothetical protein AB7F88_09765 [Pyrinomonadaceae bacterium]